jgi:hypothetical protein
MNPSSPRFARRLRLGVLCNLALGESLRASNRGGPDLRVYVGVKFEFPLPSPVLSGGARNRVSSLLAPTP